MLSGVRSPRDRPLQGGPEMSTATVRGSAAGLRTTDHSDALATPRADRLDPGIRHRYRIRCWNGRSAPRRCIFLSLIFLLIPGINVTQPSMIMAGCVLTIVATDRRVRAAGAAPAAADRRSSSRSSAFSPSAVLRAGTGGAASIFTIMMALPVISLGVEPGRLPMLLGGPVTVLALLLPVIHDPADIRRRAMEPGDLRADHHGADLPVGQRTDPAAAVQGASRQAVAARTVATAGCGAGSCRHHRGRIHAAP